MLTVCPRSLHNRGHTLPNDGLVVESAACSSGVADCSSNKHIVASVDTRNAPGLKIQKHVGTFWYQVALGLLVVPN